MITTSHKSAGPRSDARPGDWIRVHVIGGGAARRGQIVEVLGSPGHEHYRIRWDEGHESIHYPSEGTSIEPRRRRRSRAGSRAARRSTAPFDGAGDRAASAVAAPARE